MAYRRVSHCTDFQRSEWLLKIIIFSLTFDRDLNKGFRLSTVVFLFIGEYIVKKAITCEELQLFGYYLSSLHPPAFWTRRNNI